MKAIWGDKNSPARQKVRERALQWHRDNREALAQQAAERTAEEAAEAVAKSATGEDGFNARFPGAERIILADDGDGNEDTPTNSEWRPGRRGGRLS